MEELENVLAIPREEVLLASAKEGTGVAEILEAIVQRIPPPKGDPAAPLQGLIFDSHYDAYKGVIVYVRLAQGTLHDHETIRLMQSGATVGAPGARRVPAAARACQAAHGGRGRLRRNGPQERPRRPGRRHDHERGRLLPRSRCPATRRPRASSSPGIYPVSGEDYPLLRDALEKLHLNDASFTFEPESSVALGLRLPLRLPGAAPHGDRPGAARARVRPGPHRVGPVGRVPSSSSPPGAARWPWTTRRCLPSVGEIEEIREPWVKVNVITPSSYIGPLMELATNRRGAFQDMEYVDPQRVMMKFEMPLAELIVDFYDQLKSRTQGYASMDYEEIGYRPANLVKVDVLVAGEPVDALSVIVTRERATSTGRRLIEKLKELIPRQMFEVPIQAAVGSNVIARETVRAMRKNVLAKCYGGDITRKRKLLEKQKEGKQRMKRVGSVEIPQEAFLAVLRMDEA